MDNANLVLFRGLSKQYTSYLSSNSNEFLTESSDSLPKKNPPGRWFYPWEIVIEPDRSNEKILQVILLWNYSRDYYGSTYSPAIIQCNMAVTLSNENFKIENISAYVQSYNLILTQNSASLLAQLHHPQSLRLDFLHLVHR